MTSGAVNRVEPHAIGSDFVLATGSVGGPVFTAEGSGGRNHVVRR